MAEDLTKRAASGYLQDTAASSSSFSLSRQASPKPKTVRVSATPPHFLLSRLLSRHGRGRLVLVSVPRFALLIVRSSIEGRTKRHRFDVDASNYY